MEDPQLTEFAKRLIGIMDVMVRMGTEEQKVRWVLDLIRMEVIDPSRFLPLYNMPAPLGAPETENVNDPDPSDSQILTDTAARPTLGA